MRKVCVVFLALGVVPCVWSANLGWRYGWPGVVPEVQEYAIDEARPVRVDDKLTVEVSVSNGVVMAEWVRVKLRNWFGATCAVRDVPFAGGLRAHDEAYRISAEPHALSIAANTPRGVRWALMTLRQLAQPVRGTASVTGYEIPVLTLHDWPETPFRAIHFCAFPECTIPQIEREIRMAAYLKFTHVVLEPWGVFRSVKYPWYGWRDGCLTVAECHRLAALARDLGVTLVPQLNIFGHATSSRALSGKNATLDVDPAHQTLFEPLAGWNWCLTNPEARKVIKGLVDELYAAFDCPDYFHIGCDEANPPTCAVCRSVPYSQVVGDAICEVSAHIHDLGARPMMWHDMLLVKGDPRWAGGFRAKGTPETAKLLQRIPSYVVLCDWYYGKSPVADKRPTLDYFRSLGRTLVACPWDNAENIASMGAYVRTHGMLGMMGTTWHGLSGWPLATSCMCTASAAWSAQAANAPHAQTRHPTFLEHFATLWRQVGWDTPNCDTYSETGFTDRQISRDGRKL